MNVSSSQFGLPPCTSANGCFKVVYATNNGKPPKANCGWAQEAALDIEWAHAMAPLAKIVLVKAASSSYADLFAAEYHQYSRNSAGRSRLGCASNPGPRRPEPCDTLQTGIFHRGDETCT